MKRSIVYIFMLMIACTSQAKTFHSLDWVEGKIQEQVFAITRVMFHDVTDPPAAARFYAYTTLAGYEILYQCDHQLPNFQKYFKDYPVIKASVDKKKINVEFCALYGILETGKAILPSGYLLEENEKKLYHEFLTHHVSSKLLDSSISFAKTISQYIVQYSKEDGYFRLSTLSRYKPISADSAWQPTPPEYMAAVQPHWTSIRTFFLDSASQFRTHPMNYFNKDSSSSFYKLAFEVYNTGKNLTTEQTTIASFWDCNPFAVQFQGHMSIGLKKISPGGHWMGIAGIACVNEHLDFSKTMLIHTITALSLHDAFISSWDEKYRSNRIRPETVINRYIDEKWQPLIQTPPFPEYPSAHSVISSAAAVILTHFFGDHYSFTDSTEKYIGLDPRRFPSLNAAASEACISRLYGGIHFRDAIENGVLQGKEIGNFIVKKLKAD
jgi:hypothetical protein